MTFGTHWKHCDQNRQASLEWYTTITKFDKFYPKLISSTSYQVGLALSGPKLDHSGQNQRNWLVPELE